MLSHELFEQIKEACHKLDHVEPTDSIGGINLACWLGDRSHHLVAEIERLRARVGELEEGNRLISQFLAGCQRASVRTEDAAKNEQAPIVGEKQQ